MSSLRFKIIVITLLVIFLIIAGSYLVFQEIQKGIIEGDFQDKGFMLANNLAIQVATPLLVNDLVEVRNSIENMMKIYPDIKYIYVTDTEGIVLVHTFEGGFPKALLNMSKPSEYENVNVLNTEEGIIREFGVPVFKNTGYVHVGLSENRVRERTLHASQQLLILAVSAMVWSGVFIYFTGRWLTKPILKLTEGAKKIDKGILDQKIILDSKDELGELARTFNDMAFDLNQRIREMVASREQTENAQKYLETLFNSVEEGIIVLNLNHEIIKVNKPFLDMMGFNEDHVLGRSCNEILFGTDGSRCKNGKCCSIDILIRTSKPTRTLHEVDVNGNKKILETNVSLFIDQKGNKNIIVVLRNVTQEKELEEQLKYSYEELRLTYLKLKELYQLKENFVSNISHELRTPLTSLMGYAELLLEENMAEEQRHKIEVIQRNSKKLFKLIQGLLDTALIDSGNLELNMETLKIFDLATQAAEDIKLIETNKNIPVNIEIQKHFTVEGDRERLVQVFSYIVDNAIKFTDAGEVKITAEDEMENMHIRISDTGIGIPEDKLELIFERFYQVDVSDKRKYGGTGLGLWISRSLVKAHGGELWAESKNRGSTFHILLPKTVKK